MGGSGLRIAHDDTLSGISLLPPGTPRPRRSDQTRASLWHINESELNIVAAARLRGPTLETEEDLFSYHWVGGPSSKTSSHGWAGRPVRLLATRRASASGEPFVRCGAKPSQQKSIIEFGFNPWMNGRAAGRLGWAALP